MDTAMVKKHEIQPAGSTAPFEQLHYVRAQRLQELMKLRPIEQHYKRALRAFLDADGALQKALETRLAVRSWPDVQREASCSPTKHCPPHIEMTLVQPDRDVADGRGKRGRGAPT
jgi:hypothetical protein